jgi:nitrite reductase/ring-hydroxylating ferredoxin subunit
MESQFVKVASKSEIELGKKKAFKVGDKDNLLANVGGKFYAIGWKCTHMGEIGRAHD